MASAYTHTRPHTILGDLEAPRSTSNQDALAGKDVLVGVIQGHLKAFDGFRRARLRQHARDRLRCLRRVREGLAHDLSCTATWLFKPQTLMIFVI